MTILFCDLYQPNVTHNKCLLFDLIRTWNWIQWASEYELWNAHACPFRTRPTRGLSPDHPWLRWIHKLWRLLNWRGELLFGPELQFAVLIRASDMSDRRARICCGVSTEMSRIFGHCMTGIVCSIWKVHVETNWWKFGRVVQMNL